MYTLFVFWNEVILARVSVASLCTNHPITNDQYYTCICHQRLMDRAMQCQRHRVSSQRPGCVCCPYSNLGVCVSHTATWVCVLPIQQPGCACLLYSDLGGYACLPCYRHVSDTFWVKFVCAVSVTARAYNGSGFLYSIPPRLLQPVCYAHVLSCTYIQYMYTYVRQKESLLLSKVNACLKKAVNHYHMLLTIVMIFWTCGGTNPLQPNSQTLTRDTILCLSNVSSCFYQHRKF